MAKNNKNSKPAEPALVDLAAELGIPSDVAAEAIELAAQQDDPALYLRNFAADAETMAAAENAEMPGVLLSRDELKPDGLHSTLFTSIREIPLATVIGGRSIDEHWPHRTGHVQLQLTHRETHLKDALLRVHHGLQAQNARLRGRTPDEPPRPVVTFADTLKWLLEQVSLQG